MTAMSSTRPAGTNEQDEKKVSGTNHRLLRINLTASQTGHLDTAAWNRRKEAKGKLRERYIAGRRSVPRTGLQGKAFKQKRMRRTFSSYSHG